MVNSSIGNSGLLITRTLHRHKHQLRDFFNRHACFRKLTFAVTLEGSRCGEVNVECSQCLIHGVYDTQKRCCGPSHNLKHARLTKCASSVVVEIRLVFFWRVIA